jgi:predicted transcriptional regulator
MLLPFPLLMQWCGKRQKYLGWTNQTLAEKSGVPLSTISRIKADDYLDCKYSTIRSLLIALIGGTTDEWLCNAQVDKEIQAARSTELESENAALKAQLASIDAQHRQDCKTIHDEYCAQIAFLEEDLQAWRSMCCPKK